MNIRIISIIKHKIKIFFQKTPRFLAEHAFLTLLGLLFLSLFLGVIIFYQYSVLILIEEKEPEITEKQLKRFNEKIFQDVLDIWQEKEKRFDQTDLKEYPNPFRID